MTDRRKAQSTNYKQYEDKVAVLTRAKMLKDVNRFKATKYTCIIGFGDKPSRKGQRRKKEKLTRTKILEDKNKLHNT